MKTRTIALSLTIGAVILAASPAFAQMKGAPKQSSQMNLGASSGRLDTLEKAFELTKDQKKAIKTLFDDAHKAAAPVRDGLTKTHAAIAAAIQGGKAQAEIDAATKAYAEETAAMAEAEMKAMAGMMKILTETQRANNGAVSSAFFMMRGAFVDPKRWDDTPDTRQRY